MPHASGRPVQVDGWMRLIGCPAAAAGAGRRVIGSNCHDSGQTHLSRGVSGSSVGSPAASSSASSSSRQYARQRITRVNLRDFIYYMEQEREMARSLLLYRALLK
ncbi:hypothetical protein AALO_G00186640 [Alosa alosa]|uniref:Transcription initiation factor TFIID component TAF4 C-terminal domain-containing protein n=1 Tax=Alosa alosa TaxID=278164 RepID=A0AAV6G8Z6_9TELE|nr:hypothetical protein AALO_G00186640 [Alosa alosa]